MIPSDQIFLPIHHEAFPLIPWALPSLFLSLSLAAQGALPAGVKVHFHIPKGWRRIGPSEVIHKNIAHEAKVVEKFVAQGHQPWRLDPASVAAICLVEFGIEGFPDAADMTEYLQPSKSGSEFGMTADSKTYIVSIKYVRQIPIAQSLRVAK